MSLRLVALDFGSTTSKAIVAQATLIRNAVTGRTEIQALTTLERPPPVFTPFSEDGERLDEERINSLVNQWLPAKGTNETIAGGVIITGLAAKKQNAKTIADAVRARIGDAVIAVADDPGKESWLAFMGSIGNLSAAHPEKRFLNFDIGGGTTNTALGANKTVFDTGSFWIGARHFQLRPGTYELQRVSPFGQKLLQHLRLDDKFSEHEAKTVVNFYVSQLEKILRGLPLKDVRFLEQLPMAIKPEKNESLPIATFTGGVGELVYRLHRGESFATTEFGDLGVDLAQAILKSPILTSELSTYIPQNLGRATVCGLAFHGVEASGSTTFIRNRDILPLRHVPFIGRLAGSTTPIEMDRLLARALTLPEGSCLQAVFDADVKGEMEDLASRFARALRKNRFPKGIPLIIFMPQNLGKTFGLYATEWGQLEVDLLVIDEIAGDAMEKKAYFAAIHPCGADAAGHSLGSENMLVSFYGGLENE